MCALNSNQNILCAAAEEQLHSRIILPVSFKGSGEIVINVFSENVS